MGYKVKIGLSNKHVHLSEDHIKVLFGCSHMLTEAKPLLQPGQYAAEEKVDIVGPKGTLKGVRVLGPARKDTQVELSQTDARAIGVNAPVRESGKHEGTPGCTLIGPCGTVEIDHGVLLALRHIHLSLKGAEEAGVKDKDWVSVKVDGERGVTFHNVLIRASDSYENEFHLDTDEGNAAGCGPDSYGEIL